jgi:virginiamycin B lyase
MGTQSIIGMKRVFLVVILGAGMALSLVPRADAYIYWANWWGGPGTTIGRATVDGTQVNQSFIGGAHGPCGVAVDGKHIYWGNQATDTIGRAKLDGSGVDQNFITGITGFNRPCSVAVDSGHIYWDESVSNIGRASLDGTGIKRDFITGANSLCGVAVDSQHVYWGNSNSTVNSIGRANLDGTGVDQSFIPNAIQGSGLHEPCNPIADSTHVYYAAGENTRILRANLDGTGVEQNFVTGANDASPALDSRYLFWTEQLPPEVGRSGLDGTGVTHTLVSGTGTNYLSGIAVDSNTFSLGKVKRKKNGTAALFADVPGPGQVGLQGKGLKQIALSASARSSLATAGGSVKLKIKPGKGKKGRALRNKLARAGKAKVKLTVTYVPSGGDANSLTKKLKLIQR